MNKKLIFIAFPLIFVATFLLWPISRPVVIEPDPLCDVVGGCSTIYDESTKIGGGYFYLFDYWENNKNRDMYEFKPQQGLVGATLVALVGSGLLFVYLLIQNKRRKNGTPKNN